MQVVYIPGVGPWFVPRFVVALGRLGASGWVGVSRGLGSVVVVLYGVRCQVCNTPYGQDMVGRADFSELLNYRDPTCV